MNIEYFQATPFDLEQICELNNYLARLNAEKFDSTYNLAWIETENYREFFAKYLNSEDKFLLIAQMEGKMVGYVSGLIYPGPDYRQSMVLAELDNLLVVPEFQQQGIGKELMAKFIGWAKSKGANRLRTNVYAKNLEAMEFYKHLGLEEYDVNLEKSID
jgi:GNAT superfamily N-acetyltransferase